MCHVTRIRKNRRKTSRYRRREGWVRVPAESAVYLIVSTPWTLAFWLVRRAGPARSERRDRRGLAEREQTTQERRASARKTWICPPEPPQFNRSGGKPGKSWRVWRALWEATGPGSWTSRKIVPLECHSLRASFAQLPRFSHFARSNSRFLLHLIYRRPSCPSFFLRTTYLET